MPRDEPSFRPLQPRFGLRGLLLAMAILSIMAAGGYYLVRGMAGQRGMQLTFVLITVAAPLLLVVIVSTLRRFAGRGGRQR